MVLKNPNSQYSKKKGFPMCFYPAHGFKCHPRAIVFQNYFSCPVSPLTFRPLWPCPPPISICRLGSTKAILQISHTRHGHNGTLICFFLICLSGNHQATVHSVHNVKLLRIILISPFLLLLSTPN